MDARVNHPVKDQNGEKCALIKVVTDQKGFAWEAGMLGITEVKKKTGEYWVYVPYGSEKITIKHAELGVLRNYVYPVSIKKATVYEMKLTTAKVVTKVEEKDLSSAYLIINSQPEGADVYIDNTYRGKTPFKGKYKTGEHTYRLNKSKYHPKAGKIEISGDEGRKEMDFTLKPNYGSVSVSSEPESGVKILIDGESTGKSTPATLRKLESGKHTVTLKSKWYQPKTKKVTVSDKQTTNLDMNLTPVYGKVYIKTDPASDIYIDGEKAGHGNYEGKVVEGIHTFSAQKEKYKTDETEKKITVNKNINIKLNPTPKYGKLDVSSEPMNARVFLDGKEYGKTPTIIDELLVGNYKMVLKKQGYADKERNITIQKDETSEADVQMANTVSVKIDSKPSGAKLYVNEKQEGNTPEYLELPIGKAKITLNKDKFKTKKKTINVKQDQTRFNFELSPDPKFYTSKFEAIMLNKILPGWGSAKYNNWTTGIGGLIIAHSLLSSFPYFAGYKMGEWGGLVAMHLGISFCYDLFILFNENDTKQKLYSSTSTIKPGFKIQPNPVTGSNNVMISLQIDLD